MFEVETSKGKLKYRLPNIAEGYEFLCYVDKIENSKDIFRIKGKIIENMGKLIEFKEIGYETYDEVLNDKENMRAALAEISHAIFNDVTELLGKKI